MQLWINDYKVVTPCAVKGSPIDLHWFGEQLIRLAENHAGGLGLGVEIATNEERERRDAERTREYEDDVLRRAAEIQEKRLNTAA